MTTLLAAAVVVMAAASLVLSGVSLVLHKWAPKSKATADVDALRKDIDEIKGLLPSAPVAAKKPESGKVHLTLVALLGLAAVAACSLTMSCGATQKAALKNLATCSEEAAVKDLTPTVESIIANGVSTWKQQLDALGVAFGESELACAVTAAQQFFASKLGAGSDAEGPEQRASLWLSEHGYAAQHAERDIKPGNSSFVDSATTLNGTEQLVIGANGRVYGTSLNTVSDPVAAAPMPGSHAIATCESPNFMPVVDCGNGAMSYDGCHWMCDYTMAGVTITGPATSFVAPTVK